MSDKPLMLETRTTKTTFELREADSSAPTLEGYAATFNQEYDLGAFRETIIPDAFARTLAAGPDVRFLIDHQGQPLARTKSQTLELSPDSTGLHMRAKRLDMSDPDVQRLIPKIRRGDLDEMSFAFRVPTGGDSWSEDYTLRELREINLAGGDVSVVTYPANPNTAGLALRARDERDAQLVFVQTLVAEMRAGKTISAANMTQLQKVLDMISAADTALDDAQPILAGVLGVPNPDPGEPDDPAAAMAPMGRSARAALRVAALLDIPA